MSTLSALPVELTDTGLMFHPVTAANFVALTLSPEYVDNYRYVHAGTVKYTGAWVAGAVSPAAMRNIPSHIQALSPLVYTLTTQAIGSVGSVGQIRAAHVLGISSLPSVAGKSYWSMAANGNAGSGSLLGAVTFTGGDFSGTDMFGVATNARYGGYARTANHRTSNLGSWSVGCWVKNTAWATTIEGVMGEFSQSGTPVWELTMLGNGSVRLTAGQIPVGYTQNQISVSVPIDTTKQWHHFVVTIDAHAMVGNEDYGTINLYVDGILVIQETLRGALSSQGPLSALVFGSTPNLIASGTKTMTIREGFYVPSLLSGEQVSKTFAYKLSHNKGVGAENQLWSASYVSTSGDIQEPITNDWLMDKSDTNAVYVNFRQFEATDRVSLKLLDMSTRQLRVLVPKSYDSGWLSSVPTFPFNHGLQDVPSSVSLLLESSPGSFTTLDNSFYLAWNSTQFTGSVTALNGLSISPTRRMRIIAVHAAHPVNIEQQLAGIAQPGLMSAGDQHISGNKWWAGNLLPETDNLYDLGSLTNRWKSVHVGPGSLVVHGDPGFDAWAFKNQAGVFKLENQTTNESAFEVGADGKMVAHGISGPGTIPVGAVIATFPHMTGAYVCANLPQAGGDALGFVLCQGTLVERTIGSGQTIANGQVVPLINDDAFLAGSTVSTGAQVGANSKTISVSATMPTHTHDLGDNGAAAISPGYGGNQLYFGGRFLSIPSSYMSNFTYEVTGSYSGRVGYAVSNTFGTCLYGKTEGMTASAPTISSTGSNDVRPKYISAVYIMRVK
jgi:hypothetical protein